MRRGRLRRKFSAARFANHSPRSAFPEKKMRFFCFTAGADFVVLESFLIKKEMQKTKKSIAKRFKITASGKVLRRSPGKRHLLVAKSVKQKRAMGHDKPVTPGIAAIVKKAVPFA